MTATIHRFPAPAVRAIEPRDAPGKVIRFARSDDLALLLRSLRRLDAAVCAAEEVERRAAERADLLERLHVELADGFEREMGERT